jgi:hypothetical protein
MEKGELSRRYLLYCRLFSYGGDEYNGDRRYGSCGVEGEEGVARQKQRKASLGKRCRIKMMFLKREAHPQTG